MEKAKASARNSVLNGMPYRCMPSTVCQTHRRGPGAHAIGSWMNCTVVRLANERLARVVTKLRSCGRADALGHALEANDVLMEGRLGGLHFKMFAKVLAAVKVNAICCSDESRDARVHNSGRSAGCDASSARFKWRRVAGLQAKLSGGQVCSLT